MPYNRRGVDERWPLKGSGRGRQRDEGELTCLGGRSWRLAALPGVLGPAVDLGSCRSPSVTQVLGVWLYHHPLPSTCSPLPLVLLQCCDECCAPRSGAHHLQIIVLPSYLSGLEKREKMAIMETAVSVSLSHPVGRRGASRNLMPCPLHVGKPGLGAVGHGCC